MTTAHALKITRKPEKLVSDDKRVITRYLNFGNAPRIRSILSRLVRVPDDEVGPLLQETIKDFASRHRNWQQTMQSNFNQVKQHLDHPDRLSNEHQLLIGAYFTLEYSIESAALFNPSMVMHPDQRDLPDGSVRFLVSLRATGEGHISSIVFRRGLMDEDCNLFFDPPPRYAFTARPIPDKLYDKALFLRKLLEMGEWEELARPALDPLPDWFTREQLEEAIGGFKCPPNHDQQWCEVAEAMRWLTEANYTLRFPPDALPAETVIFPATKVESMGMEDLRLVGFCDDSDRCRYYGTYTAWNGKTMLPMLLETEDFHTFHISTLNGDAAKNKGIALFPRKINGQYMAIGRHDGEKLYLMRTDDVHFWYDSELLEEPREAWELTQIGNCGSPIETDAGWVLLTHGVGPVRRYCIGAMLLDRDDPSKVRGRLRQPLIVPDEDEREGYVPNVVYSCGAMIHHDQLIIPYAMSDIATTFATLPVQDLIEQLLADGP